jgi:hypothetical protein
LIVKIRQVLLYQGQVKKYFHSGVIHSSKSCSTLKDGQETVGANDSGGLSSAGFSFLTTPLLPESAGLK